MKNEQGYVPSEWRTVNDLVRTALNGSGAWLGTLRIGNAAFEFDFFIEAESQVKEVLSLLEKALGRAILCSQLENPSKGMSKEEKLDAAKKLFNEERYWECHSVLEELWLEAGGKKSRNSEALLLQGLIQVAAAFVHHQKAEDGVGLSLLRVAKEKLEVWPQEVFLSMNVASLKVRVRDALQKEKLVEFQLS